MKASLQSLDSIVYYGAMVYAPLRSLHFPFQHPLTHAPQIYAGTRRTRWSWEKAKDMARVPQWWSIAWNRWPSNDGLLKYHHESSNEEARGRNSNFDPSRWHRPSWRLWLRLIISQSAHSTDLNRLEIKHQRLASVLLAQKWKRNNREWSDNCIFATSLHPDSDIVSWTSCSINYDYIYIRCLVMQLNRGFLESEKKKRI